MTRAEQIMRPWLSRRGYALTEFPESNVFDRARLDCCCRDQTNINLPRFISFYGETLDMAWEKLALKFVAIRGKRSLEELALEDEMEQMSCRE